VVKKEKDTRWLRTSVKKEEEPTVTKRRSSLVSKLLLYFIALQA
jgi:hypothetical protein